MTHGLQCPGSEPGASSTSPDARPDSTRRWPQEAHADLGLVEDVHAVGGDIK